MNTVTYEGDKIASENAQIVTIGRIVNDEDTPYTDLDKITTVTHKFMLNGKEYFLKEQGDASVLELLSKFQIRNFTLEVVDIFYDKPETYYEAIKKLYPSFNPTQDIINCCYNYDKDIIYKSSIYEGEDLSNLNKDICFSSYTISVKSCILFRILIIKNEIFGIDN